MVQQRPGTPYKKPPMVCSGIWRNQHRSTVRKMKIFKVVFILVCLFFQTQLCAGESSYQVSESGKNIQVDGFLLEWSPQAKQYSDSSQTIMFGTINSPEGFCGYITLRSLGDSCRGMIISDSVSGRYWNVPLDTASLLRRSKICAIGHDTRNQRDDINAEWCIPWDSLSLSPNKTYQVSLIIKNTCSTLPVTLHFNGSQFNKKSTEFMTSSMMIRIVLIVMLLTIFIYMRAKIAKHKKNKPLK
jgi:hypothetical protein